MSPNADNDRTNRPRCSFSPAAAARTSFTEEPSVYGSCAGVRPLTCAEGVEGGRTGRNRCPNGEAIVQWDRKPGSAAAASRRLLKKDLQRSKYTLFFFFKKRQARL